MLIHIEKDIERGLQKTRPMRSWDDLFALIEETAKQGKVVVVFDEVQRLYKTDKSFFSSLQKWWDNTLKYLPVYLIMVGSAIGMMQKIFLSAASPLFSRKTWSYLIEPFSYREFRIMFEHLPEEQRMVLYSIFGGTPAYLAHVKSTPGDVDMRIESLCLKKGAALFDEPYELLKTELKRSDRYNAILHAMAKGRTGQQEIAAFAGFIAANESNPYREVLKKGLFVIKRSDPVGGKKKRGRYLFKDNYFHFWYRYIHPLQSVLELGNIKLAKDDIQKGLPSFIGIKVEEILREFLIEYNGDSIKGLKLNFREIGAWWTQKESASSERAEEIDIVALGDDYVLLGEIEWSNKPSGKELLFSLLRKSKYFPVRIPQKFFLFSKMGFTKECLEEMGKVGCVGLSLKEVDSLFNELEKRGAGD